MRGAEVAGQLHAVVDASCRRAARTGSTSTAPIRGCSPVLLAPCRCRRSRLRDEPLEAGGDGVVLAGDREHGAVVAGVRRPVEQVARPGRRSGRRPAARPRRGDGPRRRWGRFRPAWRRCYRSAWAGRGPGARPAARRGTAGRPPARHSGPMPGASRSLLRHPDFLKLWTAETVSVFGSAITPARAAADRRDRPAGHAVRVRPAHDHRVPAVHPAQPAGGRLGGPAPAPADPDRRRPRAGGRDRVDPGRLRLRRPHDLAAVRRRLRRRLLHRLLRRRLPELPAVRGGARPAGGRQLQARDHAIRGRRSSGRARPASSSACCRRRSR